MVKRDIICRIKEGDKLYLKERNKQLTVVNTFVADNGSRMVEFKENDWTVSYADRNNFIRNIKTNETHEVELIK